jgi:hypothetical protein
MNRLLHGIGTPRGESLIEVKDSLIADPGTRHTVVLSNPPLGRKSSLTMVGADGREAREDLDNLPAPEVIAREIVEDVTAALVDFEAVAAALEQGSEVE